jgi:DNA polymerase (family 10)
MLNSEIAKILHEMALFLEMKEVAFKPRAYEKAAQSIEALGESVADIYKKGGVRALEEIPAIGKGIAERIEEYLKTKRIKDYEKLKKQIPVDVEVLSAIEGIGPKLIKLFYQKLKIKNIDDLERAAKAGKLAKLPRSGEKLQKKILKGIEFYRRSHARFLLGLALPLAEEIEERLRKIKGVTKVACAGSLRRKRETIGDLDFLAACPERSRGFVMDYFVSMPEVVHIFARGPTKSMVQLKNGIAADVRVVEEKSFGAALQYFTGDKDHNIALRKIAARKGYKLNEYGLFAFGRKEIPKSKIQKEKYIAGRTEEEIYNKLGMDWIPPEIRQNSGEIEAAQKHKLPKLIELKDIKGDLQVHSNWTDGSNAIEEMARAAQELGYEYIAITDHTKDLAMTGGSDERQLMKQMREIDKLNSKFKIQNSKFRILKGAEVNIKKDGSLDIKDDVLEKLDIVGAAIHSNFNLPKDEQTRRLIKAMENLNVDIIFHPSGRLIGQRAGIELDWDAVFGAAKRTGAILEINASPTRLDLNDENIRRAKNLGIKLSINTDAHSTAELSHMNYGISQSRRGWTEKKDVVNTMALPEILSFLKKPKDKRF